MAGYIISSRFRPQVYPRPAPPSMPPRIAPRFTFDPLEPEVLSEVLVFSLPDVPELGVVDSVVAAVWFGVQLRILFVYSAPAVELPWVLEFGDRPSLEEEVSLGWVLEV